MLSALLAFWLLATAADEVQPPPRGRLCIGDACSDTTAATIAVKPAEQERRFFWLSADAKTGYVGVIAAKADSILLDPEAFSALDVAIDGDASRGWPSDVAITLDTTADKQWKWTLDRDAAKRLRRLYVPRATYALTATMAHHRTIRQQVVAAEKPSKVTLHFVPLLVARGIVVDAEDIPIVDATIALPDETLCASTNEQGAFTCELPERLPEVIVVSRSGYAPRELRISRRIPAEDSDFGRVRLSSARTLTLKIVRPDPASVRVSLFSDTPTSRRSKLKTVEVREGEEIARFDAAAGKYFVVVEGDGPLELLEVPLTVKDENAEDEIHVEPFQLVGTVKFGEDPIDGAVEMVSRGHTWRVPIAVSGGAFGATMWQHGVARAWVTSPAFLGSDLFLSSELGADPSRWDIRIEKRMIVGRVFDATTKAAVTDASFEVAADSGDSQSYFPAEIQPDGSYEILAHRPGTYAISVESPRHTLYRTELRISAEDRIRKHDIALEVGVVQPIDVVTSAGLGISQALILEGVRPDGMGPEMMSRTDERGHYELRGLPGQSRLLFFVPKDGSFAVARVQMARANAIQVIVPPPSCALRVRSVDAEGKQTPAKLLIRYNGDFVPGPILAFIAGKIGTGRTGEVLLPRLPAGSYEIWGFAGEEDEDQLLASAGTSREPARVGLSSGEQAVTVVVPHREAPKR